MSATDINEHDMLPDGIKNRVQFVLFTIDAFFVFLLFLHNFFSLLIFVLLWIRPGVKWENINIMDFDLLIFDAIM